MATYTAGSVQPRALEPSKAALKDRIEISCQVAKQLQMLPAPDSGLSCSHPCRRFLRLPDCQLQNWLCSFLR